MQEEKKKERVYKITIRETNTYDVEVKAGYFEEAVQALRGWYVMVRLIHCGLTVL